MEITGSDGAIYSSEDLVHKYIDMVYRLALSQTKSLDFAEDITQDVFLKFLQSDKVFESEEHVKAWLIRVTINCSKKLFLSSWFKKTVPITEDLAEKLSFHTPEQSDAYFAVNALPQKYRTVIYLYYYEEMSIKELCALLNASEGTIKSRLHRAREMLKISLKGGEFDA